MMVESTWAMVCVKKCVHVVLFGRAGVALIDAVLSADVTMCKIANGEEVWHVAVL